MEKQNIYLDLSKLSREEIIGVRGILWRTYREMIYFFPHHEEKPFLTFNYDKWNLQKLKPDSKIEITIIEFQQMFSEESEPKITRFEYITDKGREVVEYGEFTYSIQDDGRTLKVFKDNETNK